MEKLHVRHLFDSIAQRYDLLNHLLSGGVDFYWRYAALRILEPYRPKKILDVATGTADFAIAALRLHPEEIVGVDISGNMLDYGRKKIERKGFSNKIRLMQAEAETLPFENGSYDAAIVAFGARNFENLEKGLTEMHRVLRDGGSVVVLEFSRPRNFPFKQLYMFYFRRILPIVGRLISRSDSAYQYLPDTVMKFPDGQDFLNILSRIGFRESIEKRLTFGIVTIYAGTK
jgi:demethylmenaquinone methyltransferase/2-methoxy-6-polyprenyl-1,4-benzoquinol methylase